MHRRPIASLKSTAFISEFSWSGLCVTKSNKHYDYAVSWEFSDNIIISEKINIRVNYDKKYVTDLQNIFRIKA
jgi:hypothetical protein